MHYEEDKIYTLRLIKLYNQTSMPTMYTSATACAKSACCFSLAKGQLISGRNLAVFKSPTKQTKIMKDFCPT